ncbi:MAG: hypothetical protein J7L96_07000, partial [Bacteroidales bacterium]|nr:hypothetical protein [Bacteroidales bacterium]
MVKPSQKRSIEREWYRLDNAAKIYPAVTNKTRTSVFRLTVELSEPVKLKELQKALTLTLEQLPYFKSEIKKGFFWYWLEQSQAEPRIQFDHGTPCRTFRMERKNHLLMRILARSNMISAEFIHVLTDGSGGMTFLLSLLRNYGNECSWNLEPNDQVLEIKSTPMGDLYEDSYKKYFNRNIPHPTKISIAYHLPYKHLRPPQFDVVHAELMAQDVISQAKKHQVTLTEYLSAV